MHPQRDVIKIAEAIGDELYYDSRRPNERGDPEKKKQAELDQMQKSMLMPKAKDPKPIQPGNKPTTVGDIAKAAHKNLMPEHPLYREMVRKYGKLGKQVSGIKGTNPFYMEVDRIERAGKAWTKKHTPKPPLPGVMNNSVSYSREDILNKIIEG